MTPERFTNLDTWSQALEPGPCKTALRELIAEANKLRAQRDALRKRVAELEQRLDDVPCGWTEPPPRKPGLRVRAGIVGVD